MAVGAGAWLTLGPGSFAQDSTTRDIQKPSHAAKGKTSRAGEKPEVAGGPASNPAVAAPPQSAAQAAPQTAPAAAAPAPAAGRAPDFAARLRENGAGTCAAQIDALAAGSMGGVAQFNTASSWATTGGDKRAVSLSIGQKYPAGSAVPYGATSIVAAPNGLGDCDGVAVQVVPSPLSCAKLRESMSTRGKQVADLAGVPLMQDAGGQTLLVPTSADTCVLVGVRSTYAK